MKYLVEYLPNIRCVTIIVTEVDKLLLKSVNSEDLTIEYMNQNNEQKQATIFLPSEIEVSNSYKFIKGKSNEYSVRLKCPIDCGTKINPPITITDGKWDKKELSQLTRFSIRCKTCSKSIIDPSNCKKLNVMPSIYWAELMDYWHCHKPDVGSSHEYLSRYNTLTPSLNEILIGGSYFIATMHTLDGRVRIIDIEALCNNCGFALGIYTSDKTIKLYKWNLELHDDTTKKIDSFSPTNDVVLSILESNLGHSARYMLVQSDGHKILVWILSMNIGVTYTDGTLIKNAMKILYTSNLSGLQELKEKHNLEDIIVGEVPYTSFVQDLKRSHEQLPEIAQSFQNWDVAYLKIDNNI